MSKDDKPASADVIILPVVREDRYLDPPMAPGFQSPRGKCADVSVIEEIAAERRRQIEVEGWTPEHDDEHRCGELAAAAAVYARYARNDATHSAAREYHRQEMAPDGWPWVSWYKPKNRRSDLIRAAALLVAEIERLDRAAAKAEGR